MTKRPEWTKVSTPLTRGELKTPGRAAGGKARAAKLTPERRKEIAAAGGKARKGKPNKPKPKPEVLALDWDELSPAARLRLALGMALDVFGQVERLQNAAEQYVAAEQDGKAGSPDLVEYFADVFSEALAAPKRNG